MASTMTYKYVGDYTTAGLRHGKGKTIHSNGDTYEGDYRKGKRHGYGKYNFIRGGLYVGEWKEGKKHGKGKFNYSDGTSYDGELFDDLRHGEGTYTYSNGDYYKGSWYAQKRHGKGIYVYKSAKMKYDGIWKDGKRTKDGIITPHDGSEGKEKIRVEKKESEMPKSQPEQKEHQSKKDFHRDYKYVGDHNSRGLKHGKGKSTYPNGDTYEGDYRMGKRDGYGKYNFIRGGIYVGEWKEGKKHGKGKFNYIDGSSYEGEIFDDERHGEGTYTYSNGDYYKGCWCSQKRHGKGVYVYKSEKMKYDGIWKDGKPTKEEITMHYDGTEGKEEFPVEKKEQEMLKSQPDENSNCEPDIKLIQKEIGEKLQCNFNKMKSNLDIITRHSTRKMIKTEIQCEPEETNGNPGFVFPQMVSEKCKSQVNEIEIEKKNNNKSELRSKSVQKDPKMVKKMNEVVEAAELLD